MQVRSAHWWSPFGPPRSHPSSTAKAFGIKVGEDKKAEVSWEDSCEVVVRWGHDWVEEIVQEDEGGIAQAAQDVLQQCPALLLTPCRVLVREKGDSRSTCESDGVLSVAQHTEPVTLFGLPISL